jgi:hypothetical protein
MTRIRRLTAAALVLVVGFASAGRASAGSWRDWFQHDCPKPSYSPFRYWTPDLARVHDCVHGPKLDVYPSDTHPEVSPSFTTLQFPCPAASPAETIIPVPTPPAR